MLCNYDVNDGFINPYFISIFLYPYNCAKRSTHFIPLNILFFCLPFLLISPTIHILVHFNKHPWKNWRKRLSEIKIHIRFRVFTCRCYKAMFCTFYHYCKIFCMEYDTNQRQTHFLNVITNVFLSDIKTSLAVCVNCQFTFIYICKHGKSNIL